MPYLVKKRNVLHRKFYKIKTTVSPNDKRPRVQSQPKITKFFKKKVEAVINKVEEPHHFYTQAQMVLPASGGVYTHSLTAGMGQNDTNTGRQGDVIHLDAIKMSMCFSNVGNSANAYAANYYRVLIGWWPQNVEIATGNAFSATNAGVTQALMYANNMSYTVIDGIIDPRLCSVIYDKVIAIEPNYDGAAGGTTAQIKSRYVDVNLQLQKDYRFRPSSTDYGSRISRNLYLVVVPYNGNGSSDTGTVSCVSDMIWKEK